MILNLAKIYRAKTLFVVAPITRVPELSLVDIVLAMTVDTTPVFFAGLFQRFGVTGMAMQISMCMPELE